MLLHMWLESDTEKVKKLSISLYTLYTKRCIFQKKRRQNFLGCLLMSQHVHTYEAEHRLSNKLRNTRSRQRVIGNSTWVEVVVVSSAKAGVKTARQSSAARRRALRRDVVHLRGGSVNAREPEPPLNERHRRPVSRQVAPRRGTEHRGIFSRASERRAATTGLING